MSYTSLYRKLRPKNFRDVFGQDHIVQTLLNQILSNRVSHAYLFCGTRGTGKTSTAKIFSRAINCESPTDGEPCNKCETCMNILDSRSMNVLEIDAASNNSVDNVRDIKEEVTYAPTEGNYKVYIIDEVHMLSTGAFNALLKTLEEPPAHVVFILATTDPQKIPATILSRCQRFDFKRIPAPLMTESLREYCTSENVDITEEALGYISSVSDGAVRDALTILEQSISFYYKEQITLEKVLNLLGAVDTSVYFEMADALNSSDTVKAMTIINEMVENGRDIPQYISAQLNHFRNLMVAPSAGENKDSVVINISEETMKKLKEQASRINTNILIYYINAFSELSSQLRFAPSPQVMLEITCIRLCNPYAESAENYETLFARINSLENQLADTKLRIEQAPVQIKAEPSDIPEKPIRKKVKKPAVKPVSEEDLSAVQREWPIICGKFEAMEKANLESAEIEGYDGVLYIVFPNPINLDTARQTFNAVDEEINKKCSIKTEYITLNEFKKLTGRWDSEDEYNINDFNNLPMDLTGVNITEQ